MLALSFFRRSKYHSWRFWSARGLYMVLGISVFVLASRWEIAADPAELGLVHKTQSKQKETQDPNRADRERVSQESPPPIASKIEEDFMLQAGDRIFFAPQSLELSLREREILSAQARWLKAHDKYSVLLQGYADDPPLSDKEQDHLAQRRAEEVQKYLVREGVLAERLTVMSMGKNHPIALCGESVCAAQNRRVISVLIAK